MHRRRCSPLPSLMEVFGSTFLSPSRLLSSLFLSVFHFSIFFSHSALNGEFGMVLSVVNLCLGFGLGFGDGLLSLAVGDGYEFGLFG